MTGSNPAQTISQEKPAQTISQEKYVSVATFRKTGVAVSGDALDG